MIAPGVRRWADRNDVPYHSIRMLDEMIHLVIMASVEFAQAVSGPLPRRLSRMPVLGGVAYLSQGNTFAQHEKLRAGCQHRTVRCGKHVCTETNGNSALRLAMTCQRRRIIMLPLHNASIFLFAATRSRR